MILVRFGFFYKLARRLHVAALRKALQISLPDHDAFVRLLEIESEQAALIEQAVFVLRILLLCPRILLQGLLWLPCETIRTAQIGAHIGIICSQRDGLFIVRDGRRPFFVIEVPIAQRN